MLTALDSQTYTKQTNVLTRCERHNVLLINYYFITTQFSVNHSDGLVQDCSISIANALDTLQSCTKP